MQKLIDGLGHLGDMIENWRVRYFANALQSWLGSEEKIKGCQMAGRPIGKAW